MAICAFLVILSGLTLGPAALATAAPNVYASNTAGGGDCVEHPTRLQLTAYVDEGRAVPVPGLVFDVPYPVCTGPSSVAVGGTVRVTQSTSTYTNHYPFPYISCWSCGGWGMSWGDPSQAHLAAPRLDLNASRAGLDWLLTNGYDPRTVNMQLAFFEGYLDADGRAPIFEVHVWVQADRLSTPPATTQPPTTQPPATQPATTQAPTTVPTTTLTPATQAPATVAPTGTATSSSSSSSSNAATSSTTSTTPETDQAAGEGISPAPSRPGDSIDGGRAETSHSTPDTEADTTSAPRTEPSAPAAGRGFMTPIQWVAAVSAAAGALLYLARRRRD